MNDVELINIGKLLKKRIYTPCMMSNKNKRINVYWHLQVSVYT